MAKQRCWLLGFVEMLQDYTHVGVLHQIDHRPHWRINRIWRFSRPWMKLSG